MQIPQRGSKLRCMLPVANKAQVAKEELDPRVGEAFRESVEVKKRVRAFNSAAKRELTEEKKCKTQMEVLPHDDSAGEDIEQDMEQD